MTSEQSHARSDLCFGIHGEVNVWPVFNHYFQGIAEFTVDPHLIFAIAVRARPGKRTPLWLFLFLLYLGVSSPDQGTNCRYKTMWKVPPPRPV